MYQIIAAVRVTGQRVGVAAQVGDLRDHAVLKLVRVRTHVKEGPQVRQSTRMVISTRNCKGLFPMVVFNIAFDGIRIHQALICGELTGKSAVTYRGERVREPRFVLILDEEFSQALSLGEDSRIIRARPGA